MAFVELDKEQMPDMLKDGSPVFYAVDKIEGDKIPANKRMLYLRRSDKEYKGLTINNGNKDIIPIIKLLTRQMSKEQIQEAASYLIERKNLTE